MSRRAHELTPMWRLLALAVLLRSNSYLKPFTLLYTCRTHVDDTLVLNVYVDMRDPFQSNIHAPVYNITSFYISYSTVDYLIPLHFFRTRTL